MSVFQLYVELLDSQNRKTSKEFESVDLLDYATAQAAATALLTDLGNLTMLRILAYTLKERVIYADNVDAGANIDEGVTFTLEKADNYNGHIKVPGPIKAIFDGDGNVDKTDAAVTAWISNFLTGADWTFSDGEQANSLVRGKLDT